MTSELSTSIFSFLLAVVVLYFVKKRGLYKLAPQEIPYALRFWELLGAFLLYLSASVLIAPLLLKFVFPPLTGLTTSEIKNSKELIGTVQFFSIFLLFLLSIGYLFLLRKATRNEILFGRMEKRFWRPLKVGIISWVFAYPLVLFITSIADLILTLLGKKGPEQVAVSELRDLIPYRLLFSGMVVLVAVIVPFLEELLFRGFLQTFLKRYLGRIGAILLTSVLFAAAHYSRSQGLSNIQLLSALFLLSCILGFLYERERSLFASFGLHMTFNAISTAALALSH